MSELGDTRRQFSKMTTLLKLYADFLGYEYAVDFTKRCENCEVGHPNSTHKSGLAMDLHLYHMGEYLTDGSGHKQLHTFWEFLGGAEPVKFRNGSIDWNHYSIEWRGVR